MKSFLIFLLFLGLPMAIAIANTREAGLAHAIGNKSKPAAVQAGIQTHDANDEYIFCMVFNFIK